MDNRNGEGKRVTKGYKDRQRDKERDKVNIRELIETKDEYRKYRCREKEFWEKISFTDF